MPIHKTHFHFFADTQTQRRKKKKECFRQCKHLKHMTKYILQTLEEKCFYLISEWEKGNNDLFFTEYTNTIKKHLTSISIEEQVYLLNHMSLEIKIILKNLSNIFLINFEIKSYLEMLKCSRNDLEKLTRTHYLFKTFEYKKEIFLSKNHSPECIVSVGCGSVPITMIAACFIDCNKIIGIDIDKNALNRAEKLINHFQMKNCHFQHLSGELYDYTGTDILYIPNFVDAKYEIIQRAFDTRNKENFTIYVADSMLIYKIFYTPLDRERLKDEGYQIEVFKHHNQNDLYFNAIRITKKI